MNGDKKIVAVGSVFIIILLLTVMFSVLTNVNAQPIRVACIGDSITQGSGYPDKLNALLGSNYAVGNFGVCGSTVSSNSILPYMSDTEFLKAKYFHPDIVIIMLGTNDANPDISYSEDTFEADYANLVNAFANLDGDQQIFVVRSPPIVASNSAYNNTYLASTVLPQIDNVADQMNLPTIDVYNTFWNHLDYYMDGVHPNDDGATLIASTVYNAITTSDSGSP